MPSRTGRRRPDIDLIVRCVRAGRPLTFFDINDKDVVILRILPETMQAPDRIASALANLAKD